MRKIVSIKTVSHMGMGYRMQTSVTWKIYKAQIRHLSKLLLFTPAQTFAGKIKNPVAVENVFFFH